MKWVKPQSLYLQLLMFLGLPLMLLWGLSAFNSYVSALQAATQAYDRTLLSSARTVSERLVVHNKQLEVNVPWVVLDSFELNMNDRLYYKVVDPAGKVISGYDDLPAMPPATGPKNFLPSHHVLAMPTAPKMAGTTRRVASPDVMKVLSRRGRPGAR